MRRFLFSGLGVFAMLALPLDARAADLAPVTKAPAVAV